MPGKPSRTAKWKPITSGGTVQGGGCRDRALHPVEQAPLDVVAHEVVQPSLLPKWW
jgi:hypothetical protein